MKKILFIYILFFLLAPKAVCCDTICTEKSILSNNQESVLFNISGINFISKKVIEIIIQNELKEALNSDIKADLDIFNIKSMKNGEFKSLELKSPNIKYRALSLSDFYAKTICDYNKVIYINNKLKYPTDIPFNFTAKITNQDLQNIIASEEFQKELKRNDKDLFQIKSPSVEIQEGKIRFIIPIKTMLGTIKIKYKASIFIEDNKIVLTNSTYNSKSNIISDSMLNELIQKYNPMEYLTNALNGKYYNIYIKKAVTEAEEINIEGIFTINKNYGEGNE